MTSKSLLQGLNVVQIGGGAAAAVCGRLLADTGAQVTCFAPDVSSTLLAWLNHGKAVTTDNAAQRECLAGAQLIVREGQPKAGAASAYGLAAGLTALRQINLAAAIVTISPYGETGPQANDPATDLTLCFASGVSRSWKWPA